MNHLFLVAMGGAVGSAARFLANQLTLRAFGSNFPWGTLFVNVAGSLAIGVLSELIAQRFDASAELRLFLITGFLGGFTTFSAFSLDVAMLVERGQTVSAFAYIFTSLIISLFAVFAGLALTRALL